MKIFKSKPTLFSSEEEDRIVEAILQAEHKTSGEIRVHVDALKKKGDALFKAQIVFQKLKMDQVKGKNAVLFYIAQREKQIAIWGGEGIHEKVQNLFWNELVEDLKQEFRVGNISNGLIAAISKTGEKLKLYFPHEKNDINELPNEISY